MGTEAEFFRIQDAVDTACKVLAHDWIIPLTPHSPHPELDRKLPAVREWLPLTMESLDQVLGFFSLLEIIRA